MNRTVFAVVILLIIGACLPSNLLPVSLSQPTVDSSGLTQASAPAALSETATLPPTDTAVPVTDTSAPPTESPVASATETATTSPIPNLTTTFATSTEITVASGESTATLAVSGAETTTSTPSHLTYGTLPPENRPFSQVTLFNRSHAEAYISLQVNNRDFGPTIIEYYVDRMVTIRAPVGYYLYVAWVGGNKMVGNFRLSENDDLLITLFEDRVVIR
jgi:hypothetical protein